MKQIQLTKIVHTAVLTDLDGTTTSNNLAVPDGALDDHDGIVQATLHFFDELLCTTAKKQRARFRSRTVFKNIESLPSNLPFLELSASTKVLSLNVRCRRLDGSTNSLHYSPEVSCRYSTSTEDVAVGEPLSGEVSDWELAENDFRSRFLDLL